MNVILLERIANLGQIGDVVRVRDGYARNYLLPQGKGLRANEANMKRFESERAQLEARNLENKSEAEDIGKRVDGHVMTVVRQAGETGQLYGSVSARDIAASLTDDGFGVGRSQIELNAPIKSVGIHIVTIALHPEVQISIRVNVARTLGEAERQAAGEDLTRRNDDYEFVAGDHESDGESEDEIVASDISGDEASSTDEVVTDAEAEPTSEGTTTEK